MVFIFLSVEKIPKIIKKKKGIGSTKGTNIPQQIVHVGLSGTKIVAITCGSSHTIVATGAFHDYFLEIFLYYEWGIEHLQKMLMDAIHKMTKYFYFLKCLILNIFWRCSIPQHFFQLSSPSCKSNFLVYNLGDTLLYQNRKITILFALKFTPNLGMNMIIGKSHFLCLKYEVMLQLNQAHFY